MLSENGSSGLDADSWRNSRHGPTDPLYAGRSSSTSAPPPLRRGGGDDHHHIHHHHPHTLAAPVPMIPARRQTLLTTPASSSSRSFFNMHTTQFVLLCTLWYASSALSSNTGKQIMNQFRYPVTLTFIQFGFVSGYCVVFANPLFGFSRLRKPTMAIIQNTLPMAVFQVGGHIFSSMAISRVPVSTVHTIKALSPLFTVAAYALLFGVRYSAQTYISLLPLTIGVMLACSFDLSLDNALGLICAFGSAIVFVSSNIFFKKIMPTEGTGIAPTTKLDKLNLLFYSSGLAFILMIPIWAWSDLARLLDHDHHAGAKQNALGKTAAHGVTYYFILNGTVHWAQNIIAFAILASTSPVTYSIASLIKRIAVILIAIAWFAQPIHPIQGFGICLTFLGLWMYQRAKKDVERGEKKMARRLTLVGGGALPMTSREAKLMMETPAPSPQPDEGEWEKAGMPTYSVTSGAAVQQPQFSPNSIAQHIHLQPNPSPGTNNSSLPPHSPQGHQRRTSVGFSGYSLAPPPMRQAPPRLDTYSIQAPKPPPLSPAVERDYTDPYPSPPASLDSPPRRALNSFPMVPSPATASVGMAHSGGAGLYNRRPTIYDSKASDQGVEGYAAYVASQGLGAVGEDEEESAPPHGLPVAVSS